MVKIVALDLETTGRLNRGNDHWGAQPGITQIGIVALERVLRADDDYPDGSNFCWPEWHPKSELSLLIDPEIDEERWEAGAIEVTGIGPEQVKDAPNLLVAFDEIAQFVLGADYLLTYNGDDFDVPILAHQLRRYSLQHNFPWPPKHIDMMKRAQHIFNQQGKRGLARPKLGDLYEEVCGKELAGAHDALNDVRATVEIFLKTGGLEGFGL